MNKHVSALLNRPAAQVVSVLLALGAVVWGVLAGQNAIAGYVDTHAVTAAAVNVRQDVQLADHEKRLVTVESALEKRITTVGEKLDCVLLRLDKKPCPTSGR